MYYVYDMDSLKDRNLGYDEYYTERDIQDVILIGFKTIEELENWMEENDDKDGKIYWPVHECTGYSWIPVKCVDEEEARKHILESNNLSLYEYYHDL